MSTTARYPIKPKTLSLLEICQSISDFRSPPPSLTSYQYQVSPNTSQILTRRLYLHPLTINQNGNKQQITRTSLTNLSSSESEARLSINSEKIREINSKRKKKISHPNLAVLSSSFPLTTRMINSKPETRHLRDRASIHADDETNSEIDINITTNSFPQSSLPAVMSRGTFSSTRTICTRPSCVVNHQKLYPKPTRLGKINVWNHLDQTLQRPTPIDPPTTPLGNVSDCNIENDEFDDRIMNYQAIQQIHICKRNPIFDRSFVDEDENYDNYLNMEE